MTAISASFFLRWKIQPMQDVGHHLAMVEIVADYNKSGSLYPALYKPFDWLSTNSLLYTVAGFAGRIISPSWAFRLAMTSYVVGVPLTNLWAVRVFGRSAWGAVIAVPLTYNLSWIFGFANFLFAAPLAILAVPLFYRMLVKPTRGRVAAVVVCVLLLFLAHVHVFLWTGVLLCLMTLVALAVSAKRLVLGLPTPNPSTIALLAMATVMPALALFFRWFWRSTHPPPADEYVTYMVSGTSWSAFKAALKPPSQLFADLPVYLDMVWTQDDHAFFVALGIVWAINVAIARMHTYKRPPVLELACAATLASYWLLPENAAGQAVIGSRQIGFGLWLAAAFFSPVPWRVSAAARIFGIVSVVALAAAMLGWYGRTLKKFETEEAAGLEEVIAAAPPRKRLHYVNIHPESKYFLLNSFWHVEKWYMIDKAGQCNENPAYGMMNSIHYRKSFEPHRVTHHENDWPSVDEIWDHYDLVLVHRWQPRPIDLKMAESKGELVKKSGEWELWQSKRAR
jgi:hypothetical protein